VANFPPPLPLDPILLDPTQIVVSPLLLVYAVGLIVVAAFFIMAVAFSRSVPPTPRVRRITHAAEGTEHTRSEPSPPFPNLLRK